MPRIVDLTMPIEDQMVSHFKLPKPIYVPHTTHESSKRFNQGTPEDPNTFCTFYISMLDHTGTHVDSFSHMSPTGQTIDAMPIEMFMGKAVCLDLRHIPDLGDIDAADLEAAEKAAGVTVDGHIVLMCTGLNARHWPNESISYNNPGITAAGTHWLADRNSKVHGVEGPSTDKPSETLFTSHRICRDRGMTHYEWLWNLEEVIGVGEFHFQGIPLRFKGGAGSPVRALAFLD